MKLYLHPRESEMMTPVLKLTENELKIFRQRRWSKYYRKRKFDSSKYIISEDMLYPLWKKLRKEFKELGIQDPRDPKYFHPLLNMWKTIHSYLWTNTGYYREY